MPEQRVPYPDIDTPAVLADLNTLEANIKDMCQRANEVGVKFRPHIKVHESALIVKLQLGAGAYAVEVGPIGQAEAMADQGINDILVAHPGYYGGPKGEILKKLLNKPDLKLTTVVDMFEQAEIISQVAQSVAKKVPILVKIDLGRSSRYGVLPGEPLLNLVKKIRQLPGINFIGIYSHEIGANPTPEGLDEAAFEAATIVADSARMLRKEGISVEHVSVGSSPSFRSTCRFIKEGKFPEITEIHPGNCAIGDISYMRAGGNTREACTVTVLTTVMSASHPDWVVIDAGYKTFGSDSLIAYRDTPGFWWQGKPSYGSIQGRPDLWFGRTGAETGMVYYMADNIKTEEMLSLGDRLEIVPNNATLVINIHDKMYGVRNGKVEREIPVTGRGKGN